MLNRLIVILSCLLLFSSSVQAGNLSFENSSKLMLSSSGIQLFEGDGLLLMDSSWKPLINLNSAKPQLSRKSGLVTALYSLNEGKLSRTVEALEDGSVKIIWDFEFAKGITNAKYIELNVSVPSAVFANLPFSEKMSTLKESKDSFSIQGLPGIVSFNCADSDGAWRFQDLRSVAWSGKFRLIFSGEYKADAGFKAKAVLTVKVEPALLDAFTPISIERGAERSFADEIANDGKGGWTDQGNNDLACLKPGLITAAGVPFKITGKAVVLKSANTLNFPEKSNPLPVNVKASFIYVLHTAAWSEKHDVPVAVYRLVYADGKSEAIPVKYGVQINDWWKGLPPSSAKLAWKGFNGVGEVGISMLEIKNPRPDSVVTSIEFVSMNTACTPILIAATALDSSKLNKESFAAISAAYRAKESYNVDTAGWYECPIDWNGKIALGSALDLSSLNHKPAGKFGFVKRSGDRFIFSSNSETVRFWGTNAAIHGPYPEKNLAPGIAKTLAAQGCNMVRIHLYDCYKDLLSAADGSLIPAQLDKMDFFIAELKKNGIYIFMDLNDGMQYGNLVGKPELNALKNLKYVSIYNRELIDGTKKLARDLFSHKNPYTGLSLCEDPAVAVFEITNENSMTINWFDIRQLPEPYLTELKNLWSSWLASEKLASRELPRDLSVDTDSRRFAYGIQKKYLDEMLAYLKELGVKVPISATNITFTTSDLAASLKMDYMGEHNYWAHPDCNARPMTYSDKQALKVAAWQSPMLKTIARGAMEGYPLVLGEWNYCFPNNFREEGMMQMAAYGSYQDWKGLIFYGATGSFDGGKWARFETNPGILVHSQQTDPSTWGLSQAAALLYRRADVKVAEKSVCAIIPEDRIHENFMLIDKMPFLVETAKYTVKIGKPGESDRFSEIARAEKSPEKIFETAMKELGNKESSTDKVVSDTKELRRNINPALLLVDTPNSQSVTGEIARLGEIDDNLSTCSVSSPVRWASFAFSSLDGRAISSSKRILLTAVANSRNKTTSCDDAAGILNDMGKAPVLAEPFNAEISVKNSLVKKVYALDTLSGARKQEIPFTIKAGITSFSIQPEMKTIYFEISGE